MNHQESEPNCYADKWLAREHAKKFGELFEALLEDTFDAIVVGTKAKYYDRWMNEFEAAIDATVYNSEDLPVEIADEHGVSIVYSPDKYTYSEESVLLMVAAGEQIGDDLPTEHGWIVHNTETLFNIYRALSKGTPVTNKYVHVDGNTPRHRCLKVPVGTPASTLLRAAGINNGQIKRDQILADGGPGWCYEINASPETFGVRKRTNSLLVLDRAVAKNHTKEDGQIDLLDVHDWSNRNHEIEPCSIEPSSVRIPLITNAAYTDFVTRSKPIVRTDDEVSEGDVIAAPSEGISNTQHASIDGVVTEITDTHIVIEGD